MIGLWRIKKYFNYFMLKKIAHLIYFILSLINKFVELFSPRFKFLLYLKEYIESKSYIEKKILGKKVIFFCPNKSTDLRVKRFLSKEPGTLEWINTFKNSSETSFWDIGSNIGIFSIYAALVHDQIKIISFEPSTSNLRVLSRNISINNFTENISISQIALSPKINQNLLFKESRFIEGGASNVFGENFDQYGKNFVSNNSYKVYGTSIDYLIDNKIYKIPNYIKLDVDGIEHLILSGADKYLADKQLQSISVEINDKFEEQKKKIFEILKNNNFKLNSTNKSEDNPNTRHPHIKNYIFNK